MDGFSKLPCTEFDKCHFMTLGTPNTLPSFKCKNITIENSASENLLGSIIDKKLDFTERLNTVCNLKLHALNRISRFLSPEQHELNKISFQLLPISLDVLLQADYAQNE